MRVYIILLEGKRYFFYLQSETIKPPYLPFPFHELHFTSSINMFDNGIKINKDAVLCMGYLYYPL